MNLKKIDNKMIHYFVVAKPLQFIVVRSIMKQISGDSVILLVGKFQKSGDFFDFIKSSFSDFREVLYFNSIREAIFYPKVNKVHRLYLPSDIGFIRGVELFLLKLTTSKVCISIYEEGRGFYRKDLYKGIKKILLDKMGFGVYFGGSFFTQNVLVYHKVKYQSLFPSILKKIELIELSLLETILNKMSNYDSWYYDKFLKNFIGTKKVNVIFFTSCRMIDFEKQIEIFKKNFPKVDCVYYKLHPLDFSSNSDSLLGANFLKFPERIPTEYFLLKLLSMHIQINVYHYNSSIAFYLDGCDINFYDMTEAE
jgi:hypothetical protein